MSINVMKLGPTTALESDSWLMEMSLLRPHVPTALGGFQTNSLDV